MRDWPARSDALRTLSRWSISPSRTCTSQEPQSPSSQSHATSTPDAQQRLQQCLAGRDVDVQPGVLQVDVEALVLARIGRRLRRCEMLHSQPFGLAGHQRR